MATNNIQLKSGGGDLLMPKTTEGNVFRLISSYVTGGTKTGTTSAYCTINIATLAQNTTYKITVASDEDVAANCAVHKLVGNTSKGTIATLLNGTSYVENIFDTGANSINKIQIRGYQARTFTVRIYSYIEETLPTHLGAIEGEIGTINTELHNNLTKGFKPHSGLKTGSGATGTIYPLNPLPHWVAPSLYCKLVVSNISSTGSVTINALAENTKIGEIGKLGSADTYKEFLFQFTNEFNKIQFVCGTSTLDYNVQLFVISDIYRDAQKHLDYNTKSALYKSSLKCIAHQGFSIDQYTAECRRSAIIAAAMNHFDGVEVDLAFSSDDVPFLCHDTSFVSGGQTIVIENETADALVTYSYYGETICSLEEAIKLCKLYGLDIILDHTANITNQDRATAVVEILNRYRAWSNVIWTTASSVLNRSAILALYPQARFHVVSDNAISEANISNVNTLAEQGNNVILAFNWANNTLAHLQDDVLPNLDARVKLSCYTLDNTSNPMSYNDNLYKQYMPYVDYALSNVNNKFRVETGYLNIYDNSAELE